MKSRRYTVLVVEDELLIRIGVVEELEEAGFTVLQAATADVAIALLEANPAIRLLFTDVDMPGSMDGLKLAAAVRNRWPPIRVIVTSGHIHAADVTAANDQRFFAKPYDMVAVAAAFHEMLAA